MSFINEQVQPVRIYKRTGSTLDPYLSITEQMSIVYGKAYLKEMPEEIQKIAITNVDNAVEVYNEVTNINSITNATQYFVNYREGIVYFHASANNKLLKFVYTGTGTTLYPASRIYTGSGQGVVQTIQDMINAGNTGGGGTTPDTHMNDTVIHISSAERTLWNGKATSAIATTTANGLMSSADKVKLNGIATGANNYVHPTTHSPSVIAQDASNRFVTDTEKATWNAKASTSVATTTVDGLMSSADKTKLDSLTGSGGTAYVHPATHPASIIEQDLNNRFVTDAEKATWNAKAEITVVTTTANGLMPFADKVKLNGIATGANNYVHPATHPPSIIVQDANNRFMTDAERSKLTGIATSANNYVHPASHPPSMIAQDASNRFVSDAEKALFHSHPNKSVLDKITASGTETSFDLSNLGSATGTSPVQVREEFFTATAGQTLFSLAGTYTTGAKHIRAVSGGVPQFSGTDFNETNSSSITFLQGISAGTEVVITYFSGVPNIVGGGGGATGKSDHIINVLDYAVDPLNSAHNDTAGIQNAINYLIDNNNGVGVVWLPPVGKYKINATLKSRAGIVLKSTNAFIEWVGATPTVATAMIQIDEASGLSSTGVALPENHSARTTWTGRKKVLEGISFLGNASSSLNNFRDFLYGINFFSPKVEVRDCAFVNLFAPAIFNDHSYLIDFINCNSRGNRYGYHFDGTGHTDLGENLRWIAGVISDNDYNIYNKNGGLTFQNVSIDYPNIAQVQDNITDITGSGVHNSRLVFSDCWIETSLGRTPRTTPRFTNTGIMIFNNCYIWEFDIGFSVGQQPMIKNNLANSRVQFIGGSFMIPETSGVYLVDGGYCDANYATDRSFAENTRLHKNHAGFFNPNFATDLVGWNVVGTGGVARVNVAGDANAPTFDADGYSLKLSYLNALRGEVVSNRRMIKPDKGRIQLTYWAKSTHTDNCWVNIRFYNAQGTLVGGSGGAGDPLMEDTIPANYAGGMRKMTYPIINDAVYYDVRVRSGGNTTGAVYVDCFYVGYH